MGLVKFSYIAYGLSPPLHLYRLLSLEWLPYANKRERGRSETRWENEIKNKVGIAWEREVWNRDVWRLTGEAYAQEWVAYL